MEEAVEIVDPVVKVVVGFGSIGGLWWSSGETIGAVRGARDVDKCEMEGEDRDDPPIDASTGFEIWVSEHALDVACIYFDYQVPNTNEVHFERSEGTEEAVELKLGLGESRFAVVQSDGAESSVVPNLGIVEHTLTEVEANRDL